MNVKKALFALSVGHP